MIVSPHIHIAVALGCFPLTVIQWQLEAARSIVERNAAMRVHLTVQLDATGTVCMYGYMLTTLLLVNPLTGRGVPVAHMLGGTGTADDTTTLLAFTQDTLHAHNVPIHFAICIIDVDTSELAGVKAFSEANVASGKPATVVICCRFHVVQSLNRKMAQLKISDVTQSEVRSFFTDLHHDLVEANFVDSRDTLLQRLVLDKQHALVNYLNDQWFMSPQWKDIWGRRHVQSMRRLHVMFTNNHIGMVLLAAWVSVYFVRDGLLPWRCILSSTHPVMRVSSVALPQRATIQSSSSRYVRDAHLVCV